MFSFQNAHQWVWVSACAIAVGLASPASAKKPQRVTPAATFRAADLISIPKFSSTMSTRPAAALPQGPARFFTISGAMAKRVAGRPLNMPLRLATSAPVEDLADVIAPAPAAIVQGDEPFGMQAFRAPEGLLWLKWRTLEKELKADGARLRECEASPESCSGEASKFSTLVGQLKTFDGRTRLERVNQLVNSAIMYASDLSLHGQLDRWSAPLATLKLGRGDCEDYAILKYQLLVESGVRTSDLKIVLVRDTSVRIDHAVLSARVGKEWFVLDNRRSGFYAERDLPHYMPLFALDREGVKLFAAPFASLPALHADEATLPGLNDEVSLPAMADTLPVLL